MISAISERNCVRRSCYSMQAALLADAALESSSCQQQQQQSLSSSPEKINSIDDVNEELTILIEIVAATIPKKIVRHEASLAASAAAAASSLTPQARGMHCTANWIGPVNPSGRKRRETFFHRTKTLKLNGDTDTSLDATPDINTVGKFNNLEEHIFTVEDSSLFLFKTTMKQLVNASAHDDRMSNGGLKFDLYEKPVNILTTSVSNALSDIIRNEKEACATTMTRESSVSSLLGGSYRLIGTVFLSPKDIISSCDGSRIEFEMVNKLALTRQNGHKPAHVARKIAGGRLVLRMRKACETDIAFMKLLRRKLKFGGAGDDLALLKDLSEGDEEGGGGVDEDILPVQLLTEIDEKLIAAQTSFECIGHMAHATQESIRYLISDDTERKHHVRPYPDPSRKKETTMLTKSQLREECYKPSTKWVHAGTGSLGTVFVEFLECRGLPNTDTGEAVGNLTDAFISAVYGDVLVQTDVIDDCLSPMWMPWSTRAFKFQTSQPSAIFIGVTDYDVGPRKHETIGRVSIQLNKFTPGILYTLTYDLHDSPNLLEFGESVGKITVRLRVEYEEHKMLMASLKPPRQSWVTSKRKKTHQVAKYATEGPHDEDTFEMNLFWSHIDEIWGKKRMLSYMISDMFYSLIFWRNQVQGLPLHSAVVFYLSLNVVERPHQMPSYILFLCGWLMLASLMQRNNHPNPWKRGHSFLHYWNILVHGDSLHSPKEIRPMDGYKESVKYERRWTDRMDNDNKQYAKQADLYARLQEVNDDSNIRTKSKSKLKGALLDQILAPKLLWYQQWLSSICLKIRLVRNVYNWSEAEIAFFVTLALFGSSFVALFVPWAFLLRRTSRFVVWVCLGPWMRIVDALLHGSNDESRRKHKKSKTSRQIAQSFNEQHKLARIQRESALKMKAFRKLLFGRYNTRVPERGFLSRHEDIPLPESFAEHVSDEFIPDTSNSAASFYIPGQNLSGGELIPRIGHDNRISDIEEEKQSLFSQYSSLADSRKSGILTQWNNEESEPTQRFELVRSDADVICLYTPDLVESSVERSMSTTPLTEIRSTHNVTQKAMQVDLKSKLLSASLSVSIKIAAPENIYYTDAHTLDDSSNWAQAAIEETPPDDEGIEIVPLMSGDELYQFGDETSTVFHYVKDKSEQ